MTNSHVSSPSGRPLVPPDLFRLANEHLSLAIFDDKELMAMVALFDDHLSIFPQERWDLEKNPKKWGFHQQPLFTRVGFIYNTTFFG